MDYVIERDDSMNVPLSQSKLMDRFPYRGGLFEIEIELFDESHLVVDLNGLIWIRGIPICPINSATDLTNFLKGIQAKMIGPDGPVEVSDLTYQWTEQNFIEEIRRITGVDPLQRIRYRGRPYPVARMLHMIVRREAFRMTTSQAADVYGLDHCATLHAGRTVANLRETDKGFKKDTELLFEMIEILKK